MSDFWQQEAERLTQRVMELEAELRQYRENPPYVVVRSDALVAPDDWTAGSIVELFSLGEIEEMRKRGARDGQEYARILEIEEAIRAGQPVALDDQGRATVKPSGAITANGFGTLVVSAMGQQNALELKESDHMHFNKQTGNWEVSVNGEVVAIIRV